VKKIQKWLVALFIAGLALAIVAVYGCSGGGSNPAGPSPTQTQEELEKLIVGKWQVVSGRSGGPNIEQYNADHSFVWFFPSGFQFGGTWRMEGDILVTITQVSGSEIRTRILSISQTEMVIAAPGENTIYKRI
jgi:hypothetical protein